MRSSSKQTANANVPNETDEVLLPGDALRRKWRIKFALVVGSGATRAPTTEPVLPLAYPAPDSPGDAANAASDERGRP